MENGAIYESSEAPGRVVVFEGEYTTMHVLFRSVSSSTTGRCLPSGDGDRYEPLLMTFRPACADDRADVAKTPGEALHIARRRGPRQRGEPYERTILPVSLLSPLAEFSGASSATSSAKFRGSRPPLVPRTAQSG